MANSKCVERSFHVCSCAKKRDRFEYVRAFEQPDPLLQNTWIVVRIDGRAFTKYDWLNNQESAMTDFYVLECVRDMVLKSPMTAGRWMS